MPILDRLFGGRGAPAAPAKPASAPASGAEPRRPRVGALNNRDMTPYDAASLISQDMGEWFPWLGSPDLEINPFRDRIVARVRDLVRNDGWASGAVTSLLDQTIGGDLRLRARPDWRYLSLYSRGFDADWADEFARTAQALWRSYAYDVGRWCHAGRKLTMPQLFRLAFRHEIIDGESLAQLLYMPSRRSSGGQYATAVQLIDPDRLSNPQLTFDTQSIRGGVVLDQLGAPQAYYIRRAHQGDWWSGDKSWIWDLIPRETSDGRAVIIHNFTPERDGQHRSAGGIFTPVLQRMKMLAKYDQVELQAAVINAIFAAYVESPYDPGDVRSALEAEMGGIDPREAELSMYQRLRLLWREARGDVKLNGAVIPTLASGEKITALSPTRPAAQFEAFEGAMLRNFAAAAGMTYEQVSRDWSRTNYSSARGALLDAWKSLSRRRADFGAGFCTPIYAGWLEEAMELGRLPLPPGAPDFVDARTAYSACRWMGPGRGWVDPVKEAQGSVLRLDAGITTLAQECDEQGYDWEEQLDERAQITRRFRTLGLAMPGWGHDVPANQTDARPRPQ